MKKCIRCTVEDHEANTVGENGFCGHCACDYVNEAREWAYKVFGTVEGCDIFVLMGEFAAKKVGEERRSILRDIALTELSGLDDRH